MDNNGTLSDAAATSATGPTVTHPTVLHPTAVPSAAIHATAIVDGARIGAGTRVWAYAHILPGAQLGENCNVADHVFVEGAAVVGDNVTLKNNVCVWDGITIDDDVFVGPNVSFTNDRFPRSPRMPQVRERYAERDNWLSPTHVERGCSIGANATIVPGIRLGRYSFIAAGATVTDDVAPFALVAGTPARTVGSVCRCGRRLQGAPCEAICEFCGETPDQRLEAEAHLETEARLKVNTRFAAEAHLETVGENE